MKNKPTGLVTIESVAEYVKQEGLVPYTLEGIPHGLCFYKDMKTASPDCIEFGHLLAFRLGRSWENHNEAMCYKPIVCLKGSTKQEIEEEFKSQGVNLVESYQKSI